MRVFVLSAQNPQSSDTLGGQFAFAQARAIAQRGVEVLYLYLDLRSFRRVRRFGIHSKTVDGITVLGLDAPLGRVPLALYSLLGVWCAKLLIHCAIKKYGSPNVVHAHFTDMGYLATRALSGRCPVIITEHNSLIAKEPMPKRIRWIAERAYRQAALVVAVSENLARRIKQEFDVEPIVIYNIVDDKLFRPLLVRDDSRSFVFLSVGSLISGKGFDTLIRAFATMASDDEVYLKIFGDGPLLRELQLLTASLGQSKRVFFLGNAAPSKLAEEYARADCFVLCSHSETFGVVYAEALCCGCPVLSTKCGGPEGFVSKECGLLVQDSVRAVADGLSTMLKRERSYDRSSISLYARHVFGAEMVSKYLVEIYRSVIE